MSEESIFATAIGIPDPAARDAYLDRACAGNVELRKQLAALVAAHFAPHPDLVSAGSTVNSPDRDATADPDGTRDRPTSTGVAGVVIAGRYKLLQRIGEGGMGEVWMADQTEPVKRRVAVKLIRAERGTSKQVLARFEAERQAIALMDHSNVAKLFDAGTTADGTPYFVMELVRGVPLTQFCDEHKLSVPDRLKLFTHICSAVQHAHQRGVIHRDLKPTNILVESHGGQPVPKVIDFGLAKAAGGVRLTDHTLFTGFGTVLGTPLYMAPEQATFDAVDVDTRTDVFALGVILYELLTGTTPLPREAVRKAALDQVLKLVREQEAPTPSSRLSSSESAPSVAANRQTEPAKLGRFVRGELDWIVLKALEKDRNRRYESANGFAADVERFLNHEPVQAGPPTAGYRLSKFVQRNRGPVIAAGVVTAAVILGFAGTATGLIEAKRQQGYAEGKQGDLEREQEKLVAKQGELEQEQEKLKERTKEAEAARRDADLELHDNQRVLLRQAWDAGETDKMKAVLDQMRPKPGRPDLRGFETHYLDRQVHAELDRVASELPGGDSSDLDDSRSPGRVFYRGKLATNQHFVTVTATDLAASQPLPGFTPVVTCHESTQMFVWGMAVPGDPPRLWTYGQVQNIEQPVWEDQTRFHTGLPVGNIEVWDGRTGKRITGCANLLPDPELVKQGWWHRFLEMPVAYRSDPACTRSITQLLKLVSSPDGRTATLEARAQIHDLATGKTVRVLDPRPGAIQYARFSFDGKHVVLQHTQKLTAAKEAHHLSVWDADNGKLAWEQDIDSAWGGQFTRDGRAIPFLFLTTQPNSMPMVREALLVATGQPVAPLPAVADVVTWPGERAVAGPVVTVTQGKYEVRDRKTDLLLDVLPPAGVAVNGAGAAVRQWGAGGGGLTVGWQTGANSPNMLASTYRPPRAEVFPVPDEFTPTPHSFNPRREAGGDYLSITRPNGKETKGDTAVNTPGDTLIAASLDPGTGKLTRTEMRLPPSVADKDIPEGQVLVGRTLVVVPVNLSLQEPLDATGKRRFKETGKLIVFDRATGRERFTATTSEGEREGRYQEFRPPLAVSPDETRIVFRDPHKERLVCLNAETGQKVWEETLPEGAKRFGPVSFAAGGSRVVLLGFGAACVFDAVDGKLVNRTADWPKSGMVGEVTDWGITPDGRTLHFVSHGVLTLVDTANWTVRHRLGAAAPAGQAPHGRWGGVGNRFAHFTHEAVVEVWDVQSGRRVSRFDLTPSRSVAGDTSVSVSQVAYSADGTRAFVLTNHDVRVADLPRGREVLTLPLGDHVGAAARLALSDDGREVTVTTLAFGQRVALRRVFDARPVTNEELARGKKLDAIRPFALKTRTHDNLIPPADRPTTASDHFDWAVWHEGKRQWKEAVASYRAAIKLAPEYVVLRRRLVVLLRQHDPASALAEHREIARLDPDDVASRFEIGVAHERQGEHPEAVKVLRVAVAAADRATEQTTYPSRLALLNALAYNLRESGELDAAEKEFRAALKLIEGEKEFTQAANNFPSPQLVVRNLAICLIRRKKVKEATELCETHFQRLTAWREKQRADLAKQSPTAVVYPNASVAEAASDFGDAFLRAGAWPESVEWSDRAIKMWTEYDAEYEKLTATLPQGIPKRADAERQVRHDYWRKAIALNWLDKGKEAAAAIDESIKLAPTKDKVYQRMQRARYAAKFEDLNTVTAAVQELLAKPPDPRPAYFYWDAALAYSLCVRAAKDDEKLREGYAAEAIRLLNKAMECGFADLPLMRQEKDLDPIRDRAGVNKLIADMELYQRVEEVLVQMNAGKVTDALAAAAEVEKVPTNSSGVLYDLSCIYSVASAKVPDKKAEYANKAMDLLKQAVNAGWTDAAHMRTDADLNPIRKRADFITLVEGLERKQDK